MTHPEGPLLGGALRLVKANAAMAMIITTTTPAPIRRVALLPPEVPGPVVVDADVCPIWLEAVVVAEVEAEVVEEPDAEPEESDPMYKAATLT